VSRFQKIELICHAPQHEADYVILGHLTEKQANH
jgi:hypothetical protein